MWSSAQKRGGGVQQRPIFQPHPTPVCARHGVPGPRSAAAVTLVREGTRPEEGVARGAGGWPTADLDTFHVVPLVKPVSWASVFPRPCTLLIYLRETLIVFSLQYLVFFICD